MTVFKCFVSSVLTFYVFVTCVLTERCVGVKCFPFDEVLLTEREIRCVVWKVIHTITL